ncbi:MAG: GTP-binding protein, partial [Vibrio sp.]
MPALKNGYENQDKPKQVTILGGFLGAGKTSYLNQLLKSGKVAQNALVLVNDFGAINLDFELI